MSFNFFYFRLAIINNNDPIIKHIPPSPCELKPIRWISLFNKCKIKKIIARMKKIFLIFILRTI